MGTAAVPVHLIAFLEQDVGFSTARAALLLGLIGPVGAAGRLGFGVLGDAFTKRYVLAATVLIQAAGLVVLAFTEHFWHGLIFLVLFAVGHGGGAPVWIATRAEYFGRKHYATISGYGAVLMLIGSVVGPIFAGLLSDHVENGYAVSFVIMAILGGLGSVMIFFSRPPAPKRAAPPRLGAS